MRGVRELRLRPGLVDPVGRTALKAGEGRICGGSFDASAQRRPIAACPGQARALQSLLVAFIAQVSLSFDPAQHPNYFQRLL